MMKTMLLKPLILLALAFCATPLSAGEPAPLQRYGIIIGINEGGPTRSTLKFAATDAQAFASVMQDMGGLTAAHRLLLLNPNLRDITQAFTTMKQRLSDEKDLYRRQEFILYYSGHSDEEGLLIGKERLGYKALRTLVSGIPSDVRIAVIDSCASGVFIRTKGGVQKPPFMVDAAADMKGYAFLTSSSETEAAQESDRIEGSFFTHYLVSGLRGAADATKDGVVTLNEAYHFAFSETLVRTEKTQYGPQHPSYDIQLSGTGDLVLTDLRETSAGLLIADEIRGRVFIRNHRGKLVVELNKQEKGQLEIGLEPGAYSVLVDYENLLRRADVRLVEGRRAALAVSDLRAVKSERTARRGGDDSAAAEEEDMAAVSAEMTTPAPLPDESGKKLRYRPFQVTFYPKNPNGEEEVVVVSNMVFNLTVGAAERVQGAQLSIVGGIIDENLTGFQGATVFNITHGNAGYYQAAGVFNITGGRLSGGQTASVFNIAGGGVTGFQGSAVFNISGGDVIGGQLSLLNIAGDVTGGQVGLVNIAKKVSGVQVGLINIAEENNGIGIGLFTYSSNGIHNFEISQSTDKFSRLAFKFGTKYFYTILMGGYNLFDDQNEYCYGAGWGGHLPIGRFFIDLDAILISRSGVSTGMSDVPYLRTLLPQVRLKAGFTIFNGISIFAGMNVDFYSPYLFYNPALVQDFMVEIPLPYTTETCKLVPSFFFGVQIF